MTKRKNTIIRGTLDALDETGSEGIVWMLYDEKRDSYNSLHLIEQDDYLVVYKYKDFSEIYWEGKIHKDYKTNLEKIKMPWGTKWEQQVVKGYGTVHWLQKDVDPSFWARMFFDEMDAELEKK